jgi:hypothetical protein
MDVNEWANNVRLIIFMGGPIQKATRTSGSTHQVPISRMPGRPVFEQITKIYMLTDIVES